jgi:hypothetical protein
MRTLLQENISFIKKQDSIPVVSEVENSGEFRLHFSSVYTEVTGANLHRISIRDE